jgi:LysM repeat protein
MSGINPPQIASKTGSKATARSAATSYTVRRGDTLAKIAARFNISVESLKTWNRLSTARLTVGKKLVVAEQPAPTAAADRPASRQVVHKVQPGETLVKIATAYKTSVDAILSWNKKNDLSVIHPGDQITIFLGESR